MRTHSMRGAIALFLFLLMGAGGCATTREITIAARPDDASLSIDGQDMGRGPITRKFVFRTDQDEHDVTASRIGYKDETVRLTRANDDGTVLIELKPQSKHVTINVAPVPGRIVVDGRPIADGEPRSQVSMDLEFTADRDGHWTTHTIAADRPNWAPVEETVRWSDPSATYTLELGAMRKDLSITSTPTGAQVAINGQTLGTTPLKAKDVPFPVDPSTGDFSPQRVTLFKAGYDPYNAAISWDGGKGDYHIDIPPKTKLVRITTDPPGAIVKVEGQELVRDSSGISTGRLAFVPIDDRGTLPTFKAVATKKTADAEWHPQAFTIAWDEGRSDYSVHLREVRSQPVELIQAEASRTDDGWQVAAHKLSTLAMKDVTEPGDREQPTRITDLPRGTIIDSLAISPDGSQLLLTTLWMARGSDALRSRIDAVKTDGSGTATVIGEESALSLTPSYTPDGSQILFASNRAGRRLSIWSMSANGEAGITQLTGGEENCLWPVADSDPKPRLFYEALVDPLGTPRVYMTRMGTTTRTDLARAGGTQPRINPKGDRIVYCTISEKTGKRQIALMPDRGGPLVSIGGDADADEYDPVWSKDGGRIAFASNRAKDDETGNNYDIWVVDLAHPERPVQVTQNGSWDDRPQWDPSGRWLYFRSNRGGQWAVWKIAVPQVTSPSAAEAGEKR